MADSDVLSAIAQQIELVRQDAREARDGMIRLTAAVQSQDMGQKLETLRSDMKGQHEALRQDVVLAITNVRTEMGQIRTDVDDLKEDRNRREGGLAIVRVMKDYGGWFVGFGATAMAIYDKLAMKG